MLFLNLFPAVCMYIDISVYTGTKFALICVPGSVSVYRYLCTQICFDMCFQQFDCVQIDICVYTIRHQICLIYVPSRDMSVNIDIALLSFCCILVFAPVHTKFILLIQNIKIYYPSAYAYK